jgi:hypothetical protein
LYEELTAWKQAREKGMGQKVRASVPALPGGGASAGTASAGYGASAGAGAGYGAGAGAGAGAGGGASSQLLQQMVSQGYTVDEIMQLAKARPELAKLLFGR